MSPGDPDFDRAVLESYLSDELDEEVVGTEVVQNGVNLTVAVSTADRTHAYVLQRPNDWRRRTPVFCDVRREFAALEALQTTPVEVPEPVLFCEDESIAGDVFYLMTHLEGTAIAQGSGLPEAYRNAADRERTARLLVETLAEVHAVPVDRFEGVFERRAPVEELDRAVDLLDRATSVTGRELPRLRAAADWLRENVPERSAATLVHGDYKPDNVVLEEGDRPRVAGVIDWEMARVGDPLTDLGFVCLFWRDPDDPTPSVSDLAEEYPDHDVLEQLRRMNEVGFWPFTTRPGTPTRREVVERYETLGGVEFENDRFYRGLAGFKLAAIWETWHQYLLEESRESPREPMVDYVASIVESTVEGELDL